ncbi:1842_t:CDS:2 [Acaulospora colombiana]|uniref:1842_t:CDS:1 n=1 Tax=Acaulospora colombiana TaxID=27376 RepID=A0ACA9LTP1_9GLOM|nr:1842_t:CDS:2 [Acaulospora colombiana]
MFFSSEKIRKEYRDHNDGKDNLVQVNDGDPKQKISPIALSIILVSILGATSLSVSVQLGVNQWIDLLYFLSYVKLGLSFIKYLPQIYLNFERKSTVGWSIHNILLDFTGGLLSTVQLVLDAYSTNNWDGILGDPVKLGLGFLSIAFDLIFMFQHYILYRNGDNRKNEMEAQDDIFDWERERLLPNDKENRTINNYV